MAKLFHSISKGAAAAVFAEDEVRANDTDRRRRHDLVGEWVSHHAVLMNAGLVCEGVGSDDSFVRGATEADELAEELARRVELVHLDVVGMGELIAADHQGRGYLFERCISGTFADAVDGALHLTGAALNSGKRVG